MAASGYCARLSCHVRVDQPIPLQGTGGKAGLAGIEGGRGLAAQAGFQVPGTVDQSQSAFSKIPDTGANN